LLLLLLAKPSSSLTLDWVHGYRGFDCRNNIFYTNPDGSEFLFHAASLTIVQDINKRKQNFFGEHTDDITALGVYCPEASSSPVLIATGEMGKMPAIHLYSWSNGQFQAIACMKGFHTKGTTTITTITTLA